MASTTTPTPPKQATATIDDAPLLAPAPERIQVLAKDSAASSGTDVTPAAQQHAHGVPEIVVSDSSAAPGAGGAAAAADTDAREGESGTFRDRLRLKRKGWGEYIRTRDFWIVLAIGQVLSICLTSTNVFSELLAMDGVSIPAFQNLFNYAVLGIVYTSFTLYKYGFKKWGNLMLKDSWRYIPFAFVDVEGNYFFVLAYRYTTILSVTLIDFWAIVVVVAVSIIFLKVRYHLSQYLGILICIGGLGILLASDHITGYNQFSAISPVKGDLFALLGASFYGVSNVLQEYLISKRPFYEVLGQLGLWGTIINGVQAGIFDRSSFQAAVWSAADGGYLAGYTLILSLFYSVAPILLRMASAAFFNISLLTSDFWSVIIGLQRFHLHVHWMYPIAFVLIVFGFVVYFLTESILGDAHKPWLGENQEKGVRGVGTARRKLEKLGATTTEEIVNSENPA